MYLKPKDKEEMKAIKILPTDFGTLSQRIMDVTNNATNENASVAVVPS